MVILLNYYKIIFKYSALAANCSNLKLLKIFFELKTLLNSKVLSLLIFTLLANSVIAQSQTAKVTPSGTWYYEYLPADYMANDQNYPLMIFFHGLEERGDKEEDLSVVARKGPPMYVENGYDFPFILISPQLKTNLGNWPPDYMNEVVEHVLNDGLQIDLNRIYITGLSLGGGGAWFYAQNYPDKIAAVAPVCGNRNNKSQACAVADENIPIWSFHGSDDEVVPVNRTINMIKAIKECKPAMIPEPRMTIYKGLNHNSWSNAYRIDNLLHTPNLYEWFMEQRRTSGAGIKRKR